MAGILDFFGLSYVKAGAIAVVLVGLAGMGVTIKLQHDQVIKLEVAQGTLQQAITERDNAIKQQQADTKDLQAAYQTYIADQKNQQQITDYLNSKLTDTTDLIKDFEAKPTPEKIKPLEKSLSNTYNDTIDCISFESGKKNAKNPCKASTR